MSGHLLSLASVTVALAVASPAFADTTKTVTATGIAQTRVVPKNRNSEASIQAAVDAAERAGIKGAMNKAREYALQYAAAASLTLGGVLSVTDAPGGRGPIYGFGFGYFGPNQYCGTEQRPVFKRVGRKHQLKIVGFKRVHVCFVPPFATTALTVTYTAS